MRRCAALALPGARRALTPPLRPPPLGAAAQVTLSGSAFVEPGLASGAPRVPGAPTPTGTALGSAFVEPGLASGVLRMPGALPALTGTGSVEPGVVGGLPSRAALGAGFLHPGAPAQRDTWRLASSGPSDGSGGSSNSNGSNSGSAVSGSEGAGAVAEGGAVAAPGPSDLHPTAEIEGTPARFEDAATEADPVAAPSRGGPGEAPGAPGSSLEGAPHRAGGEAGESILSGDERELMRQRMKARGGYSPPVAPGQSLGASPPAPGASGSAPADVAGADEAMALSPPADPPPSLGSEASQLGSVTGSGQQLPPVHQGQGPAGAPEEAAQSAVERALSLLQRKQQQQRQEQQARARQGQGRRGDAQAQAQQGRREGGKGGKEAGAIGGEKGQGAGAIREVTAGVPGLSAEEAVDRAMSKLVKPQQQRHAQRADSQQGRGRKEGGVGKESGGSVAEGIPVVRTAGVPGLTPEEAASRALEVLNVTVSEDEKGRGRVRQSSKQATPVLRTAGVPGLTPEEAARRALEVLNQPLKEGEDSGAKAKQGGKQSAPVVRTAGVPGLTAEEAARRALELLNQTVGEGEESFVTRKVTRLATAEAGAEGEGTPAGAVAEGDSGEGLASDKGGVEKEVVLTPGVPGLSAEEAVARAMEVLNAKQRMEREAAEREGLAAGGGRAQGREQGRGQRGLGREGGEGREGRGGRESLQGQVATAAGAGASDGAGAPPVGQEITAGVPGLTKEDAVQRALDVLARQAEGVRERSSRQGSISRFAEAAFSRRAGPGTAPGDGGAGGAFGQQGGRGRDGGQGRGGPGGGAPGGARRGPRRGEGGGGGRGDQRDSSLGIGIRAAPRTRVSGGKVGGRVVPEYEKEIQAAQWTPEEEERVAHFLAAAEESQEMNERLHRNFLLEFEPEYEMGNIVMNPDIDESPMPPLKDVLESAKDDLMQLCGMKSEDEFQAALNSVLERASGLEALVESYAGPQLMTARQANAELAEAAAGLPATRVDPGVVDFTQRALLTLQNNPSWPFQKKKLMLQNIVRTLSKSARP